MPAGVCRAVRGVGFWVCGGDDCVKLTDNGNGTISAELVNDLGINSLELADLVLLCEERFDIEIGDDDIHKFVTVGDVVDYLSAKADE